MVTVHQKGYGSQDCLKHDNNKVPTTVRRRRGLVLLIAMAVFATCTVASAQTLIGSSGAGWLDSARIRLPAQGAALACRGGACVGNTRWREWDQWLRRQRLPDDADADAGDLSVHYYCELPRFRQPDWKCHPGG